MLICLFMEDIITIFFGIKHALDCLQKSRIIEQHASQSVSPLLSDIWLYIIETNVSDHAHNPTGFDL